jgi:hypothetical protein
MQPQTVLKIGAAPDLPAGAPHGGAEPVPVHHGRMARFLKDNAEQGLVLVEEMQDKTPCGRTLET